MPKVSDLRESKFLKQTDVGDGVIVTISGCEQLNVAKEGADAEMKWCLTFEETEKPLVLNSTNGQLIERILGSDDLEAWVGGKIVLYTDPNVSYGGKIVGGIRARAPKPPKAAPKAAKPKLPPAEPADYDDSDPTF